MIEQLTFMQIRILRRLLPLNQESPRRELAEYLGVTSSSLNTPLAILRTGELLSMSQIPGRGNSHIIRLTKRGDKVIRTLDESG